jgi:hypothetical protein
LFVELLLFSIVFVIQREIRTMDLRREEKRREEKRR